MSRSQIQWAALVCKGQASSAIVVCKAAEWLKTYHCTMNQRKCPTWATNRPWSTSHSALIIIGSTTTTWPTMGGFSPIWSKISRIISNKRRINPKCNLVIWLTCFSRIWVPQKTEESKIGNQKAARALQVSRRTNRRSVTNKLRILSNAKKSIIKRSQIKQARWARNKKQRWPKARKRKRQ